MLAWAVLISIIVVWIAAAIYFGRKMATLRDPHESLALGSPEEIAIVRIVEAANAARDYRVVLDGQAVGRIAPGGILKLPLSPGRHVVLCRIDWASSKPLEFEKESGKALVLECGCAFQGASCWYGIFIAWSRYLFVRQHSVFAGDA